MKTFKFLMAAAIAVPVAAGPALAQTPKPAAPPAHAEDASKAAAKSLVGDFVAADQAAKTVTVKHVVEAKAAQLTFGVEEGAWSSVGALKPGDHVRVTYVEMGGKRIIKTIVKA